MLTYRLGTASYLEAFQAANHRNQEGKDRCFDDAHNEMLKGDVPLNDGHELRRRYIQHQRADHGAAHHARDHPHEGENGQAHHHGHHPGQHEQFNGVQAQGADSIELLVNLHGANVGGERAGGSAGQKDRGQQHPEFPQEGKRHQVHRVNGGAKIVQHGCTQKSHHSAHQKRQQCHDGQGIQAGVMNRSHKGRHPPTPRPGKVPGQGAEGLANKAHKDPQQPEDAFHLLAGSGHKAPNEGRRAPIRLRLIFHGLANSSDQGGCFPGQFAIGRSGFEQTFRADQGGQL